MSGFLRKKLDATAASVAAALSAQEEGDSTGGPRPTGPGARVAQANRGLSQEVIELRERVATLETSLDNARGALTQTEEDRMALQSELDGTRQQLQDAEARLAKSDNVVELHPSDIVVWSRANRDARSVRGDDPALKALVEDLRRSRQDDLPAHNTVPVLVRPSKPGSSVPYELIYGRRRHAGITALVAEGTPAVVRAEIRALDDLHAWVEMTRENELREDLSALEKARSWLQAIEDDALLTQQALADVVGVTQASVSQHLELARLERAEPEIFEAIGDPREIRRGWSKPLAQALASAPDAVRALARKMLDDPAEYAAMNAAARFRALCAVAAPPRPAASATAIDGLRAADGRVMLETASLPGGRVGFAVPSDLPPEAVSAFSSALREWLATYRPDLP